MQNVVPAAVPIPPARCGTAGPALGEHNEEI